MEMGCFGGFEQHGAALVSGAVPFLTLNLTDARCWKTAYNFVHGARRGKFKWLLDIEIMWNGQMVSMKFPTPS